MRRSGKIFAFCAALAVVGIVAGAQLGSILKGGAIAVAVDKFGPEINKAINGVTGQHDVDIKQSTKVVPIISVGSGGYMGAVQVAGPEEKVKKVQAVAQLEGSFKAIGGVRLRALIPISTKNPKRSINRVEGVGVSALVDFKL